MFALLLLALTITVNLLQALLYKLILPFSVGFPALFFETNTGLVLLFVLQAQLGQCKHSGRWLAA